MTAAILQSWGLRVGLFTSPHLRSFSERIRIDGEPASASELQEAMDHLRPRLSGLAWGDDPALAFEAVTALAAWIFVQRRVDVVVWEAGIGGRYDATRIFGGSVGVLVSVDLEHTAILGKTLKEIALDKADIVEEGASLVLGNLPPTVKTAVTEHCERRGVAVCPASLEETWQEKGLADLSLQGGVFWGLYHRHNAVLAWITARRWLGQQPDNPTSADVLETHETEALSDLKLPGRMERVSAQPEIWVDVAHSPGALLQTAAAAREVAPNEEWVVIFGVSEDKKQRVNEMIEPLKGLSCHFVCACSHHRGLDAERVKRAVEGMETGASVSLMPDPESALDYARRLKRRILVTGSLFLAVEISEIVAGRDPKALLFYG